MTVLTSESLGIGRSHCWNFLFPTISTTQTHHAPPEPPKRAVKLTKLSQAIHSFGENHVSQWIFGSGALPGVCARDNESYDCIFLPIPPQYIAHCTNTLSLSHMHAKQYQSNRICRILIQRSSMPHSYAQNNRNVDYCKKRKKKQKTLLCLC